MAEVVLPFQLGAGHAAAIVAPARCFQEIIKALTEGTSGKCLLKKVPPGLKGKEGWIEGIYIIGQPVPGPFFFRLKGSKQAVPNDEDASMVLVKVFEVGPMVDPVM